MTDANYWGINGKISRTLNGNDLVVSIVDYDGSNFSALNPLVYKIGDTPRILDEGLSITISAGANTFNAGSAELATKEIDYFVYLAWRTASSAMSIIVSRIPYATTYADFSTTLTDEKFGYFSAAPASTDPVVNIGRFNATNSGSASYNWSIPATSLIINRPIFETRWLQWTIVYTGFSTAPTSTNYYKVVGDLLYFHRDVASNGSGNATTFTGTFPFKFVHTAAIAQFIGVRDNGSEQSTPGHLQTAAGSNIGSFYKTFYQGAWTNPGPANGKNVYMFDFSTKLR